MKSDPQWAITPLNKYPGLTSQLHDMARVLMSDNDPDRIIICMEVRSFFSFINMMIDKLLHSGLSLRQFRPVLGPRTALIRDAGYPELAKAIADDLDRLELKLQKLQELQAAGASSYIADRAESRLEAWRDARVFTGLEVQIQRDRVDQVKTALAEKSTSLSNIHSCIASSEAKIAQLRRELQVEEENLSVLELTRVNEEEAQTAISKKLELSEQKLVEVEEEAAKTLNADEESFRVELQKELQQAYNDELSKLKQQIFCHKLDV